MVSWFRGFMATKTGQIQNEFDINIVEMCDYISDVKTSYQFFIQS